MTRFRQVVSALLLVLFVLLGFSSPAFAHAQIVSTTPSNGERLKESPSTVTLRFNEPVEVSVGAIRVLDSDAKPIAVRNLSHAGGDAKSLEVSLPSLDDGLYVATWRITSADSHPVQGASTFGVGEFQSGNEAALSERALASTGDDRLSLQLLTAARVFTYGGLVFAAGSLLFWLLGWNTSRSRKLGERGALIVALAACAGIVFQGAVIIGGSVWDGFKWSAITATAETHYGKTAVVRAVVMLLFWVLMTVSQHRLARVAQFACLLVAIGSIVSGGHAISGQDVVIGAVADSVHVAAMCVWLGGLSILVFDVLRVLANSSVTLVARFSRIAFVAVSAIVVSGVVQAWRQVGSLDALRTTDFGQILMVKTSIVVVLLLLGWFSRLALRNWIAGASAQRLGRVVALEVVAAVAVLIATSLLVNEQPAKAALARPSSSIVSAQGITATIVVDPAKVGRAAMHIYANVATGQPATVQEATAKLSLPEKGINSLDVKLIRVSPSHHASYGFDLPVPGTWDLVVTLRTSATDQSTLQTKVKVR